MLILSYLILSCLILFYLTPGTKMQMCGATAPSCTSARRKATMRSRSQSRQMKTKPHRMTHLTKLGRVVPRNSFRADPGDESSGMRLGWVKALLIEFDHLIDPFGNLGGLEYIFCIVAHLKGVPCLGNNHPRTSQMAPYILLHPGCSCTYGLCTYRCMSCAWHSSPCAVLWIEYDGMCPSCSNLPSHCPLPRKRTADIKQTPKTKKINLKRKKVGLRLLSFFEPTGMRGTSWFLQ